jgi:hypothetical protein
MFNKHKRSKYLSRRWSSRAGMILGVLAGLGGAPVQASEVAISGLVEAELGITDGDTDVTAATVELGVDAKLADNVDAHVKLLFEEDDTALEVDEATISYGFGEGMSLTAGRQYVPFGNFETNLVSDPLTLDLAETRESALKLGFESGGLYGSVYTFNGDSDAAGATKVQQFGAQLGFGQEEGDNRYNFGVSYTSALGDSDTIQDAVTPTVDSPAGIGIHGVWRRGPLSLIGEYVAASEAFVDLSGAKPTAMNLEVGYDVKLGGRDATVAAGYQNTTGASGLSLSETRTVAAISFGIAENTGLAFEVAQAKDYAGATTNTVTMQLAAEF